MGFAGNGPTQLYFEEIGPATAPAVLLCGGTGRQCIDYDEDFCAALVAAGFRAIRFDSRDVGMSSGFTQSPSNLGAVYRAVLAGERVELAYSLADMAQDAQAVLDAAGVDRAHCVGRSLGGAVAQMMAISAPDRVASLSLIMTNSRSIAADIAPETIVRVEGEALTTADDYVARQVRGAKVNALPQDFDEARIATEAARAWQRGVHPGAIARHFAVSIGMPDLRAELARVAVPTVVLHGAQDRTIPLDYARETAMAIPDARLTVIADMGHDGAPRVRQLWLPAIIETIERATLLSS